MKKRKYKIRILILLLLVITVTSCKSKKDIIYLDRDLNNKSEYVLKKVDLDKLGMGKPAGICTSNEFIYVCDTTNNCIVKLNNKLEKVNTFGTLGMEDGNFSCPLDITFEGDNFYVLDSDNNRVQKFSSNFEFIEAYYLEPLSSEQGFGQYLSIAVDKNEIIYVSVLSPDENDAHIYYFEDNRWKSFGKNKVGYLCDVDNEIYFANMLEFSFEKDKTIIESGKNILYRIKENKLDPIVEFEDKYVPVALTSWNNKIFLISAGGFFVNTISSNEKSLLSILTLPEASLYMDMTIDDIGNIYVTDNENGEFYVVSQ